jgi:antitoxin YefM
MARYLNLKDLRPKLSVVMDAVDRRMERYIVTKRGEPVAIVMSPDDYESLVETLDILSDKALMKRLAKAERDVEQGRVKLFEKILAGRKRRAPRRAH